MSLEQTPSDKKSLAAPTPTDGEGLSQAPQRFTVFISVSTILFSHYSDTLIIFCQWPGAKPSAPRGNQWILLILNCVLDLFRVIWVSTELVDS